MFLAMYANERDELREYPGYGMLGRSGNNWVCPEEYEMIPLPKGASLIRVPGSLPVGVNCKEEPECLQFSPFNSEERVFAVAALLPQGFTRTLLPAGVKRNYKQELPLFGYAAVGFKDEKIYVAAVQTDEYRKWHPTYYNTEGLPKKIQNMLNLYPENQILRQLAKCSLEYSCFTAQNIFYRRWEGGIPTMASCNARCIGCISESHAGVDSPQNRINYQPSVQEIVEIGLEHLKNAKDAIISFGQGCEGEPSLNDKNISAAISQIRTSCNRGTININTNAGYTPGIKRIVDAGLDAMRVTVFSFHESSYNVYHRPCNYRLDDVRKSIWYAKERGVRVAVNLLTIPGFTDTQEEIDALLNFIHHNPVDMIQIRNLNIDPDVLFKLFPNLGEAVGICNLLAILNEECPGVQLGSYSYPVR